MDLTILTPHIFNFYINFESYNGIIDFLYLSHIERCHRLVVSGYAIGIILILHGDFGKGHLVVIFFSWRWYHLLVA